MLTLSMIWMFGKEILLTISNLRISFFGGTSIAKNIDKEKSEYSGYGITFDSAGWWGFDNGTARNVIIFDVDNSSSSHSDNRKNILLTLGESPSFGLNGSFAWPQKKFILILLKQTESFACLGIIKVIIVNYLLLKTKSLNLNPAIKMLTFQLSFV